MSDTSLQNLTRIYLLPILNYSIYTDFEEIHHTVRRNKYPLLSITHPESTLNKEIRVYWTHAEA